MVVVIRQILPLCCCIVLAATSSAQDGWRADPLEYRFTGRYGQVEVGGPYAGAEFHNSLPLTRAANAANNGIYAVDANGVYTFGAGDANKSIKASYAYTGNAATANQFTIQNQLLGLSPFFKAVFSVTRSGKVFTAVFNKCVGTKLSFATKLEDFMIPEFDFSIMADDGGNVGTMSVTEG